MAHRPTVIIAYKLATEALALAVPAAVMFVLVEILLPGLLSTHVPLLGVLGVVAGLVAVVGILGRHAGAVRVVSSYVPGRRTVVAVALGVTLLLGVDFARQADMANILVLVTAAAVWAVLLPLLADRRDA